MPITCLCTQPVLDGTALTFTVALTTQGEGETTISVGHDADYQPTDLIPSDWAQVRNRLPYPEHLDALLNQRYGTFVYDSAASRWRQ